MKKCIHIGAVVSLLTFVGLSSVHALPGGYNDNGMNYIDGSSDLSRWSCGIYMDGCERGVEIDRMLYEMETDKVMGYVGYDLKRWLTLYGVAGSCESSVWDPLTEDSCIEYAIGLKINLLDHEIMDPTLVEDQLRLNAGIQYSAASLDWQGSDESYGELSASLTIGLVNDIEGNALYLPNGIGIFGGAIFSDYITGVVQEQDQFGYTAGLEVYYTERVIIEFRMVGFDDTKFLGGIHLRL